MGNFKPFRCDSCIHGVFLQNGYMDCMCDVDEKEECKNLYEYEEKERPHITKYDQYGHSNYDNHYTLSKRAFITALFILDIIIFVVLFINIYASFLK